MTAHESITPTEPGKIKKPHGNLGRKPARGISKRPERAAWRNMRVRCCDPEAQGYKHYGGRGITVCQRWLDSFEAFYADMGPRPSPGYSLDRIDNDGHYCPENCRWATRQMQNSNKSDSVILEHDGKRQTAAAWARELGINKVTLLGRLVKGWSVEHALTRSVGRWLWRGPSPLSDVAKRILAALDGRGMLNPIEFGVTDAVGRGTLRMLVRRGLVKAVPVHKGKSRTIHRYIAVGDQGETASCP